MFHNRIASDLRKHFSTVGPSPSSITAETPVSAGSPSSPTRLVLLPASRSAPLEHRTTARDARHLLEEFVKVSSHRIAAFLAEASVLVLVLGILDRFLASNRFELHWVGGAFLISIVLLAASIVLEFSARIWLSRASRPAEA